MQSRPTHYRLHHLAGVASCLGGGLLHSISSDFEFVRHALKAEGSPLRPAVVGHGDRQTERAA